MTGFEPRTSGNGSNRSTNWANWATTFVYLKFSTFSFEIKFQFCAPKVRQYFNVTPPSLSLRWILLSMQFILNCKKFGRKKYEKLLSSSRAHLKQNSDAVTFLGPKFTHTYLYYIEFNLYCHFKQVHQSLTSSHSPMGWSLPYIPSSLTRFRDFLDFGQLFKAFRSN